MRIAVVSDVHGDLVALEAVVADLNKRSPDLVLHGGDLAVLGPDPVGVVDRVREFGWDGVQGNTDELLWRTGLRERRLGEAPPGAWSRWLFDVFGPWAGERLGEERIEWLSRLPEAREVEGIQLLHARPGDLWTAPAAEAGDAELRDVYGRRGTGVVVYGHIHRPYVRDLGELRVANSGSVGLPSDGDPRPSYLLLDGGQATVVRVEHDRERSEARIRDSGIPLGAWLVEFKRRATFAAPTGIGEEALTP